MRFQRRILQIRLISIVLGLCCGTAHALGPLKADGARPRYFIDSSGMAVYLTGAHLDNNLIDRSDKTVLDFSGYLDFLQRHHLNFVRLWVWEQAAWTHESAEKVLFEPLPYQRTGPANALDGKLKFDLTRFDQAYFDRLRSRVAEAQTRGIYVSVMLFQGFSSIAKTAEGNPWPGHPFHRDNNVNGIDGDPSRNGRGEEVHSLKVAEITKLQEEYARKVIDTLNGFDNVLYEISGEAPADSKEWQYHMIEYIKSYQKTKTYQHPVGISYLYRGAVEDLFASPADWVLLSGSTADPSLAAAEKVIIQDMDPSILLTEAPWQWVWKSFMRGYNPIYLDRDPFNAELHAQVREAFSDTATFARLFDLASLLPSGDLCSSGYCLVNPAFRYLVYLPTGEPVTVDLSAGKGNFTASWFNPLSGQSFSAPSVRGGGKVALRPPFQGEAVLYLVAEPQATPTVSQSLSQQVTQAPLTTSSFSLSTVGALSVAAGSSATANITATLLAKRTFQVNFSVSGLPSGASASFSRNSCRPTCSTALTIKTSAATPPGTYTLNVRATSSKGEFSASIALTVTSPSVVGTVATPTMTPNGGAFTSSVSVTLQTSTAGAAIYYTTDGSSVTQSSRLYTGALAFSATTLLKAKAFKSGVSPSSEASAWFNITIPFDFSLANGGNKSVTAGAAATNSINASLIAGSAQPITFSASGLPSGATASFSPASCSPTCTSVLTINTSATTPAGGFPITVTASGGGVSKTTSFALSIATGATTTPGLVAHWRFDEGSGTTTADATGNGNTAALLNGPVWSSGKIGKALFFDGSDDNLVVANSSSLNLSGAFTISAWVNPASTFTDFRSILAKNYTYYLYASVAGYCGDGTPLGGFAQNSDVTVCHPSPLPMNAWSHIAVTYDGAKLVLYRDGVAVANRPASGSFSPSTGSLQIGASQYGEYFQGLLDEIRVYNKALTATEIQAAYQQDSPTVSSSGQTYYVASNGSDSNPGSISQPFRTIGRGLSALQPKGTLYIRSGTYAETINSNYQTIPTGTSWSDAPVISAYPGETVVLRPGTTGEVIGLAHSYIRYVIFNNLIIDAANAGFGVSGWGGPHHVRFQNGVIRNASKSGVLLNPGNGLSSDHFEFVNMKIHNNGVTQYDHGIYIATSNNLVDRCEIYSNSGYGIHVYNGTPGEQANSNILRNNAIHDNAFVDVSSAGIILSSGDGNLAYNNIIRNNSYGISVNYRATNSKVYNNVLYANTYYGIDIGAGSTAAAVKNNLAYGNGYTLLDAGSGTAMSNNMMTDPQFVNSLANDFRLQSSSPAINAGVTLTEVTTDFNGVARPQYGAYDIGAYEFQ